MWRFGGFRVGEFIMWRALAMRVKIRMRVEPKKVKEMVMIRVAIGREGIIQ